MVIADKRSASNQENVTNEAKDLETEDVRVIPVAMGSDADVYELQKITPWLDDIIETDKDENPFEVVEKILGTGFTGKRSRARGSVLRTKVV